LSGIFDPSAGADKDQGAQGKFGPEDNVQGDPRPKRIAEQVTWGSPNGRLDRFADQASRGGEVSAHAVGTAMTRKVDANDRAGSTQLVAEGPPEASGLSESMQEDQWWTGPARFNVEWHVQ
jgi:hypothetical protein